jgi:hypothetical protein
MGLSYTTYETVVLVVKTVPVLFLLISSIFATMPSRNVLGTRKEHET